MIVFGELHPSKSPWAMNGLFLRGGNVCTPLDGKWFTPPWPTRVWRWYCRWTILPFLCITAGRFGFYIGFKHYGVDRDEYKNWMPSTDVYPGSEALTLSMRFTTHYGV